MRFVFDGRSSRASMTNNRIRSEMPGIIFTNWKDISSHSVILISTNSGDAGAQMNKFNFFTCTTSVRIRKYIPASPTNYDWSVEMLFAIFLLLFVRFVPLLRTETFAHTHKNLCASCSRSSQMIMRAFVLRFFHVYCCFVRVSHSQHSSSLYSSKLLCISIELGRRSNARRPFRCSCLLRLPRLSILNQLILLCVFWIPLSLALPFEYNNWVWIDTHFPHRNLYVCLRVCVVRVRHLCLWQLCVRWFLSKNFMCDRLPIWQMTGAHGVLIVLHSDADLPVCDFRRKEREREIWESVFCAYVVSAKWMYSGVLFVSASMYSLALDACACVCMCARNQFAEDVALCVR